MMSRTCEYNLEPNGLSRTSPVLRTGVHILNLEIARFLGNSAGSRLYLWVCEITSSCPQEGYLAWSTQKQCVKPTITEARPPFLRVGGFARSPESLSFNYKVNKKAYY